MLDPYFPTVEIEDKVYRKHHLELQELREVFRGSPRIYLRKSKDRYGDRVYRALGRTSSERYVTIIFVAEPGQVARIITARDMDQEERRRYERR